MARHLTQKRRKTMKMIRVIKRWYDGEQTSPLRKINGRLVVVPTTTRRHWTAQFTYVLIRFFAKEWRVILPIATSIVSLVISILAYCKT